MSKIIIPSLLFLFSYNLLFAQNQVKIDSLEQVLQSDITDKERVDTYVKIAQAYYQSDSLQVFQYANKAIELAEKIAYQEGKIDASCELGWMNMTLGNYANTEAIFKQVIQDAQKIKYKKGIASGYDGLGFFLKKKGEYEQALDYHNKALKIFQDLDNQKGIALSYNNIGTIYRKKSNYETALDFHLKALKVFQDLDDKKGIIVSYQNLAQLYENQAHYDKSLDYYSKMLNLSIELEHKLAILTAYNAMAGIYLRKGNYQQSLDYFFKALRISEEIGNRKGIFTTFINIGNVYYLLENYEKALDYYFKALQLGKEVGDKGGLSNIYNNIGAIYDKKGDKEQALEHYFKSLKLSEELEDKLSIGLCLSNIGGLYNRQNELEQALEYLFQSLEVYKSIGSKAREISPLIEIGIVYRKQKKWMLAKTYLKDALQIAQKNGLVLQIRDIAEQLALAEKGLGNYQAAYDYQVLFKQMADSLKNEEQTKRITRLEMNYEFEQEKDSIQFANEAEQLVLEKDIQNRKITQRATFIGLALLAVLAVVLFVFFQSKRRSNRLLTEKTEALETANEEIKTINEEVTVTNEELQTANESINQQNEKLKELNDVKNKLFSIISHDLRGPLGNILTVIELLVDGKVPEEEATNILEHLKTETGEVSTLFDNLLYWAKSQMEKGIEAHPRKFNLQNLVTDNLKLISNRAQNKNISLVNQVDSPQEVYADKDMVKLIIRNILHNALKFTPEGKNIYLSMEENEEFAILKIQDEGIGMTPETLETLFQPKTTQLSSEGMKAGKGTGLGLMLSQEFISQNKGEIRVESRLGEGSIFYIQLPK